MHTTTAAFFSCTAVQALLAGGMGLAQQALAAGGHHAVDDAALLAPGECVVEAWLERGGRGAGHLLHLGPACRIGAVELGLNLDRSHRSGVGGAGFDGAQMKWAHPVSSALAVGVVLSAGAQRRSPHAGSGAVVVPVTWQPAPAWQVHLNFGRDFRQGAPDTGRSGAALEWGPAATWSFVAERYRDSGSHFGRVGGRYTCSPAVQLDLSRAWGLDRGAPDTWTAGLNWVFAR